MPIYNGELFIEECVLSILRQSRLPDEIILVDDGSTDGTWLRIQAWEEQYPIIKAVRISKQGVSAARNFGASLVNSEYLFFLDVDDRWFPDKLLFHENHLAEHLDCDFSFSLSQIIEFPSKKTIKVDVAQTNKADLFNVLMHEFQILGSCSSVCLRKELFDELEGFKPELSRGEDWDLWVRCASQTTICQIPNVLVSISLRGDSVEQTPLVGIKNYYSTALHLKVWATYSASLINKDFSRLAIRILFADLWKNRYVFLKFRPMYTRLLLDEGSILFPKLKLRGNKFLVSQILLKYFWNRRKIND